MNTLKSLPKTLPSPGFHEPQDKVWQKSRTLLDEAVSMGWPKSRVRVRAGNQDGDRDKFLEVRSPLWVDWRVESKSRRVYGGHVEIQLSLTDPSVEKPEGILVVMDVLGPA